METVENAKDTLEIDTKEQKSTETEETQESNDHEDTHTQLNDTSCNTSSTNLHAGKNQFNLDITHELSSATRQIACYGVNLFSEGIHFTKEILYKQQQNIQISSGDIDSNYEMIDEELKNIIPTDTDHIDGQIFLMKSDTRIQNRMTGLLMQIGIELPIQNWSWFDLLVTGILKCGTIKLINYIDRDLIGKLLLGLCWVIPPFIKHFFDTNISAYVSNIVIQTHAFICLLMIMFGIYDIISSLNKYDWKTSWLFSLILITFSVFFYLLFYSQNVFNALLCVVMIPLCWRFIRIKGGLLENTIHFALHNKKKLKEIYAKQYEQELYMNETEYVVDRVYDITDNVLSKKRKRRRCAFCALLLLWICFVLKFYGHVNHMMDGVDVFPLNYNNKIEDNVVAVETESVCSEEDVLCLWIVNQINLPQYLDIFREHGFESMELICSVNEDNLKVMEIVKQAHINLFLKFTKRTQCMLIYEDNLKVMEIVKQAHINLFLKFTKRTQCMLIYEDDAPKSDGMCDVKVPEQVLQGLNSNNTFIQ
eukprot:571572_1